MTDREKILYPSTERVAQLREIECFTIRDERGTMRFFNDRDEALLPPYLRDLRKEAAVSVSSLKKVIISSSSEAVAEKCAKYLVDNEAWLMAERELEKIESDPYGIYDEDICEDGYGVCDHSLCCVSMRGSAKAGEIPVNIYSKLLDDISSDAILYEGLSKGSVDIDTKIFAILAKGAEYTFIWITPDMVGESWVTDLRMRHGFDLFAIGDVPDTYYDEVLSKLIEDGGFVLDEGLDVRGVVRVVRKLRGGAFAEEDLKWMIGYAGGRCNETRSGKKLLTRDAFDIAAISKKNALSRLEEMPGLSEVKTLVMEQVALLKEAKRNDKLSDIHSNMLFFGKHPSLREQEGECCLWTRPGSF